MTGRQGAHRDDAVRGRRLMQTLLTLAWLAIAGLVFASIAIGAQPEPRDSPLWLLVLAAWHGGTAVLLARGRRVPMLVDLLPELALLFAVVVATRP